MRFVGKWLTGCCRPPPDAIHLSVEPGDPELLVAEELLTKTYFPDKQQHQRSDASQLRRKALAARLKRR